MPGIIVTRATDAEADEIATVYLASRAHSLPYLRRVHGDDDVREWVRSTLLAHTPTWAAWIDGRIVGFMSLQEHHLDQLYVLPGYERRRIGSTLMAVAKECSDRLELYAFQRNEAARAFYAAHGFQPVAFGDGSGNEEAEPDVLYEWRHGIQEKRQ